MTAETADPGPSVKVGTAYTVFVRRDFKAVVSPDEPVDLAPPRWLWEDVGEVTAGTPQAAMRIGAERYGSPGPLVLRAVASRYVHEETLKPTTVTTWETA